MFSQAPLASLINPQLPKLQMLHFIYYSTNIRTEYFKHAAHSPFFPLKNVVYFIMLAFFGACVIHILYTGCAKI